MRPDAAQMKHFLRLIAIYSEARLSASLIRLASRRDLVSKRVPSETFFASRRDWNENASRRVLGYIASGRDPNEIRKIKK